MTLELAPEPLPWSALHLATFRTHVAGRSVLTIGLRQLYPGATRDIRAAVQRELAIVPIDAIVLDLRSNTGGIWTEVLQLASVLIDGGPVLVVKRGWGRFAVPDREGTVLYRGPVVVAVDGATEGAPEALALALQGRGRAVVVGAARTFGHGTWQEYRQPAALAAIALTVGRFHSVTGYSPQGVGVASDVVIDGPVSSPPGGGEAALEGALPNEVIPAIVEVPCRGLNDELIKTLERRLDSIHGRIADPTWLGQLDAITNLEAGAGPPVRALTHASASSRGRSWSWSRRPRRSGQRVVDAPRPSSLATLEVVQEESDESESESLVGSLFARSSSGVLATSWSAVTTSLAAHASPFTSTCQTGSSAGEKCRASDNPLILRLARLSDRLSRVSVGQAARSWLGCSVAGARMRPRWSIVLAYRLDFELWFPRTESTATYGAPAPGVDVAAVDLEAPRNKYIVYFLPALLDVLRGVGYWERGPHPLSSTTYDL